MKYTHAQSGVQYPTVNGTRRFKINTNFSKCYLNRAQAFLHNSAFLKELASEALNLLFLILYTNADQRWNYATNTLDMEFLLC